MKRSSEHIAAQRAGRIRDEGVCQVCGSRISPEGHHIVDYACGGSSSPTNIVTMCHNCHMAIHHKNLFISKF